MTNMQYIRHIGKVFNAPICDIFGIFDIFGVLEHFKLLQYVEYAEYVAVAYWSIGFYPILVILAIFVTHDETLIDLHFSTKQKFNVFFAK